jgi:hypothetical protein
MLSPAILCAVIAGQAFLVNVFDPNEGTKVAFSPVMNAREIAEKGLVLLVGFCEIVAINASGVAWETPRIALDEIVLDRVEGDWLFGIADPDFDGFEMPFKVNLNTGAIKFERENWNGPFSDFKRA